MRNYLTIKNIAIAVVVLAIIAGGVFYFLRTPSETGYDNGGGFLDNFFPSSSDKPGSDEAPTPTPQAPGTGNIQTVIETPMGTDQAKNLPIGTLIRLTDEEISSLVPTAQGSVKYHKNIPESLGHLFEKKADGSSAEIKLSNYTIPQVMKVVWAQDATKAVIFYNIGGNIRKLWIDYKSTSTPKTNILPDSVSDVAFSPDGKSMAFINDLETTRNVFTASADFKNQKKVLDNNIPDLELSWPAAPFLAIKTKSSYAATGYLYTVSISNSALTKIAEGLGLDAAWNTDGSSVLISTVNGGGQIQPLQFLDMKTQSTKELNARTIAEKCVFLKTVKNVAYCGTPKFLPSARYPDAWWQGAVSFEDNFSVIDAQSGNSSVFVPTPADIINPKLLANDSYLLFRDKNTGFLWSLKLK
ncbi:hypothetical protein A2W54_00880 [Candidatus Giovannonibacteria bacterium RIFCSPHIGHO2_02_43_13]|uniref:Dipeptidylpeptidase IV N-terminal domain-containing protein n=1 Tax=Candidatus Giovannonibacteria bacterium RIFCSPHIGHO2_02_43_13 TaxID=1798330 RepID=A0A1F5WTG1_9BACT|nr:MAG: hypothetical protein UW28_C0017G0008 [Parcubacteria group bacterium GW2011_GWA2_44_13]OGF78925.1 MAG: hypothetical protein A2W54_00880 [Candidatus Giovannonibacteria bacterium RIFCSPHIGHO2_02_43_13]